MARRSNRDIRRRQIADALLAEIVDVGYDRATIAAIAKRAGLTPGLIHYHFKSKQAILIELIQYLQSKLESRYKLLSSRDTDARSHLKSLVSAYLAVEPDADALVVSAWVMIAAEAAKKDEVREHFETVVQAQTQQLRQLLERLLKHERKSTLGSAAFVSGLIASINGCYLLARSSPSVIVKGFSFDWLWQTIERFVACQPEVAS